MLPASFTMVSNNQLLFARLELNPLDVDAFAALSVAIEATATPQGHA